MYEELTAQAKQAVTELLDIAKLKPGKLFVIGCSSSEMVGARIGVFIMSVLKTGLANCGLQAPWQTFLTGAVVIGAVLLDIARTKAANRVKKG